MCHVLFCRDMTSNMPQIYRILLNCTLSQVCLGGYVGIYKFDDSSRHWQYQTEISAKSREKTVVSVNT